jgi:uncharacterized protein (TIGR03437 family)
MKALFLLMTTVAAAQALPASQATPQTPPYRTGTRVVEITIAANAAGKPVKDLRASDFRLFDNDQEQTIASFEKLSSEKLKPGAETIAGGPQAKGPMSHPPQRLSVIVLDALNTPWIDQLYGAEGVCRMLSQLPPGNRVAIFALDDNLHLLHDFTGDYSSLRAAVDRYESEPVSNWLANGLVNSAPEYPAGVAASFEVRTRSGLDANTAEDALYSAPAVFDDRPLTAFEKTNRILYTLQALTQVADLTHGYPGPKSILWVTGGFPIQFETYIGPFAAPEFFHLQTAQAMRELGADNAALYPISPDGLNWSHIASMKEMADETGGKVFYESNNVSALIRDAMEDMREGYVLTFVPTDRRENGSLHQLRVETARPGVELRYRRVYVADSLNYAILPVSLTTPGSQPPRVASVANVAGDNTAIAPNSWVRIDGRNLAPAGDERTWQRSDFVNNQMPAELDGVGVTMNGKSAYVYYTSPEQVNVLTPPDLPSGPVQVKVTADGLTSAAFTAQAQESSPALFTIGHPKNGGVYVMGKHANGSDLGPASLYPGRTTPAAPGELVVLFGNGFGPISHPVVDGSTVQSGALPALPEIKIGGVPAEVHLAGLASPGVYQFDVVVPASAPHGDDLITASYNGRSTQPGVLIAVQ